MFLRFISALLLVSLCATHVNADGINGAGIRRLEILDPIDQQPMEAVAFFPSSDPSGSTSIGPYEVAASKSGSITSGSYPLILLSHGNMGSMWGHHDLAASLARQGYAVVSVAHPGDNF